MLESRYQANLCKRLRQDLPGCWIQKEPTHQVQGIPDLLILWGPNWARLEVKRSANEPYQPNQEYYLELFGNMSFTATIYPENEEEVLNDLYFAFGVGQQTCST